MITHVDPSIIKTFLILALGAGLFIGGFLGWKIRGIVEDAEDHKGVFGFFSRFKRKGT